MNANEWPSNFEETVNKIISKISEQYTFGIYEKEDVGQEIWLLCLDAIDRWDKKRSIYNFLLTHCKNRLRNLKRNKYFRYECPCKLCNFKENGQTDHKNKKHCSKFLKWRETNNRKSNLVCPQWIGNIQLIDMGADHEEMVDRKDFLAALDKDIPPQLRNTYLKMLDGVAVPHLDKNKILQFLEKYTI